MRRLAPLCVFLAAVGSLTSGQSARAHDLIPYIVDGRDAEATFGQYVVRIVTDRNSLCTGTFIDPSWVLTAAHCVSDRAEIYGAGTNVRRLTPFGRASGTAHPFYDDSDDVPRYDFGLFELDTPADLQGIVLPGIADYSDTWSWSPGRVATTIGWGLTEPDGSLSDVLQRGDLTLLDDLTCETLDLGLGAVFDPTSTLCANDTTTSACNGDSGGPLLVTNESGAVKIVGVTSYGPERCDGHSVFAWTTASLAWVRSLTGLPLGSGPGSTGGRTVARVFGLDRFETAAAVGAFWEQADVVFVATGGKFPDAVAAGASAAGFEAPVLLVNSDSIPESTKYQIRRLAPSTIYVAGGSQAIGDGVVAELGAIVGSDVVRLGGADRYETADLLGQLGDVGLVGGRVWVASGRDFADPLVASSAAAVFGEAFVLIDGVNPLPARTLQRLTGLAPSKIVVLGPDSSFSPDVRTSLETIAPLQLLTGGDPSWRSAVVWGDFTKSRWVSLATVENFPDALAAVPFSALAPASPLMLVPKGCVPTAVQEQLVRLGTDKLALLGGPAALNETVESLQPC